MPEATVVEDYDFIDFEVTTEIVDGDTTTGTDGKEHAVHGGNYTAKVTSVTAKIGDT